MRGRGGAGLGPRYWRVWAASAIANLGDGTSQVAYPWLATLLTRDPVLIAGLAVALRLPWLLVSLPAGALVDRGDRRRLMLATNLARAALSAALAGAILSGLASIWLLYLVALAIGCCEVVHDNAAQTILPRLVPPDRLERANGNLWGAEMVANQFVGPPLGGLLVGIAVALPFVLDAVSFGVAALLIALLAGTYRAQDDGEPPPAERVTLRGEIAEGVRWLWRHPLLRTLAVVLGVMNATSMLVFATFVLFAQELLGLGATGYGLLLTAGAVGGVLGSLLGPNLSARLGTGPTLVLTIVVGGLTSAVTGLTSAAWVVAAMSVAFTFTGVLWNVVTVALRQTIIPDRLLGRVNSVYRFFGWGMMPVGAALGGVLVGAVEPLLGRAAALRSPWLFAAVVYGVLLVTAGRTLTTARIDAARRAA